MHIETQFSVFLINKPGVLASVTGALAKAKINVIALSLSDAGEHGVLRVVPEQADKARDVLGKAHDRWTETDVLVMELANQPGAFAAAAEKLATEHVNISYAYCTGGAPGGKTSAVFKVADLNKARKALASMESPGRANRESPDVRPGPGRRR
jgi:hypothetical protein